MKATRILCCLSLLICISCNIKAPLDNLLAEANDEPASYVHFSSTVDTIAISDLFPGITSIDSVFSASLDFKAINCDKICFLAEVKDSSRMLHDITITRSGQNVTLIVAYDTTKNKLSNDTSYIISKGYLNNRLLFEFSRRPDEFYVLWQNVVLPAGFITFSSHGFSVLIPKEAKKHKQSYIRVFGANGCDATLDLRVSLIYGIPVPSKEWPE